MKFKIFLNLFDINFFFVIIILRIDDGVVNVDAWKAFPKGAQVRILLYPPLKIIFHFFY